jgi:type I restriction enzyme R subunit
VILVRLNEADTRAQFIDPALEKAGWLGNDVRRGYKITSGRILSGGRRGAALEADYFLQHKGKRLAVVEAKRFDSNYTEGHAQAVEYATKLGVPFAFATNGRQIRFIDMRTGHESDVSEYPTPDELILRLNEQANEWLAKFESFPYENKFGDVRYYQSIAVERALSSIAKGEKRILLTLATGTGKTRIAFQIAWKLFHTKWNIKNSERQPRILFLADRNVLADQAFNEFSAFPEDALVRVKPSEVSKKGRVPTNGSIFFTIFQSFMTASPSGDSQFNFGDYPRDFFDLIIIDECHRGGSRDESSWRGILDYFEPAVQIGLTATPKRKDNVDTYAYFGEPKFIYSLKDGINDGFLTPFRVRRYQGTMDNYVWTSDDVVLDGAIEAGKEYESKDFNVSIEIREREKHRVQTFLGNINSSDKTIIFCASQNHALLIRDIVNELKENSHPQYCVRVTSDDGALGDQYLDAFRDNEKSIPTILTTSQKLSTGVDARNIRNIVILRPVKSMIEFKQIIGRGTRLFEGKNFFTIHDFENASALFHDPEWDGEPEVPTETEPREPRPFKPENEEPSGESVAPGGKSEMVRIKLADGKERTLQSISSTMFYSVDGTPLSLIEFIQSLYDILALPDFFRDEAELRSIWSDPVTRQALFERLEGAGFSKADLVEIQALINAGDSDLFDVLEYIRFALSPVTRKERSKLSVSRLEDLSENQKLFVEFLAEQYEERGVDELEEPRLARLLEAKYSNVVDGIGKLGGADAARKLFLEFQENLYLPRAAYSGAS